MTLNNNALISDDDVAEERLRQLAQANAPATGSSIYDDLPFLGFDLTDEMLEALKQRFDLRN